MGRRRIEMYRYREVLGRMRAGDSDRELARAGFLGRDRATTFRAIASARGWLDETQPLPEEAVIASVLGAPKRAGSTVSAAEPWRAQIMAWEAQGVQGTTIHAALCRDHGFTGSYSSVVRLLQGARAARLPETTIRLQFAPGEAAQVDFGAGPLMRHPAGDERRVWAFVMTLCFSRHQYVEFVWDQTVATWLGCHRRAFEWFGGVPGRLIIDNAKCAIVRACRNDPEVQRSYGECALGYGFKIDPCPPHDPQKKGIVESGVKYVKKNFLPLRQFRDLADLNAQARRWIRDEAGIRVHGTTRQTPTHLFELELESLSPLPSTPPDLSTWRRATVHRDCHVQFDRAYYSAPFTLVGKRLWLRVTDTSVAIYHEYSHVATHGRALRPGQRHTVRDHLPPNAASFLAHDRRWCEAQAREVGTSCLEFIQRLLGHEVLIRLRAAQNVLRLARTYTPERLEAACQRALAHDSVYYGTVKSILRGGFDRLPANIPGEQPYVSGARFARDAQSLFGALH
jgi:transposase